MQCRVYRDPGCPGHFNIVEALIHTIVAPAIFGVAAIYTILHIFRNSAVPHYMGTQNSAVPHYMGTQDSAVPHYHELMRGPAIARLLSSGDPPHYRGTRTVLIWTLIWIHTINKPRPYSRREWFVAVKASSRIMIDQVLPRGISHPCPCHHSL